MQRSGRPIARPRTPGTTASRPPHREKSMSINRRPKKRSRWKIKIGIAGPSRPRHRPRGPDDRNRRRISPQIQTGRHGRNPAHPKTSRLESPLGVRAQPRPCRRRNHLRPRLPEPFANIESAHPEIHAAMVPGFNLPQRSQTLHLPRALRAEADKTSTPI